MIFAIARNWVQGCPPNFAGAWGVPKGSSTSILVALGAGVPPLGAYMRAKFAVQHGCLVENP